MFQLTFIGLARQAIYILYVVAFPLISNTQKGGPAADLEILMRDHRWFAPIHYAHSDRALAVRHPPDWADCDALVED
jgi:hypothetical protein